MRVWRSESGGLFHLELNVVSFSNCLLDWTVIPKTVDLLLRKLFKHCLNSKKKKKGVL